MCAQEMRQERDSMGELEVPADAYYGGNVQRARLNFPISDLRFNRSFIKAIAQIKQSAAVVNKDLGTIEPELADAIVEGIRQIEIVVQIQDDAAGRRGRLTREPFDRGLVRGPAVARKTRLAGADDGGDGTV